MWPHREKEQGGPVTLEVRLQGSNMRFRFKQKARAMIAKQSPGRCGSSHDPLSLLQGHLQGVRAV